jgi:hypothetical protein
MNSFFYSGQIRRFLQQFVRLLSNFQIELGKDQTGTSSLLRVPIYYGDSSRQAATILRNNSENSMPSVPAMSVYISAMRYDQRRLQEPFHVSKLHLREREVDDNGEFTNKQGDLVTVERLMPVPYTLTLKVDIWTSNTEQKLQLLEQIAILFNPSLEIQSTDNFVDWSSLSYITLTDTNFTSRSIPVGTEDPIDIATLTFELPIWISAPAKVKKMGVIQRIIESIWDAEDTIDHEKKTFDLGSSTLLSRRVYTPVDCNIVYLGNTLQLFLSSNQIPFSQDSDNIGDVYSWPTLIEKYGTLTNGISEIRLEQDDITIIGTVSYHPTDTSRLIFNPIVDTLPANNLSPITAIINPTNVAVDSSLLNPAMGTRFLILDDIGSEDTDEGAPLWNRPGQNKLIARANDIIEFNGAYWFVAFDSSQESSVKYLTNLRTNIQYKWKDNQWTKSVEGRYGAGAWSFVP